MVMDFQKQLAVVESIAHADCDIRMDCPFCTHSNTFIIKKNNSKLSWYCFHASCNARGKHTGKLTMEDVQATIENYDRSDEEMKRKRKSFSVPPQFTSILSNEKCIDYIRKNNCYDAYKKGKASFMYDPRQNRIAFLIQDEDKNIRGAIGRGLNSKVYPKWYIYGEKETPFICGDSDIAVLVEDCASACAVSEIHTGVALMGTSLPDSYIPILKTKFRKVIVALDRDATTKSFAISNKLRYFIPSEVKILEDDLKYFEKEKIKEMFI